MCGIVAYVGSKQCQNLLIEGLKRLEYRGYDSAGIAIMSPQGKIEASRSVGRVAARTSRVVDMQVGRDGLQRMRPGRARLRTGGPPSLQQSRPRL